MTDAQIFSQILAFVLGGLGVTLGSVVSQFFVARRAKEEREEARRKADEDRQEVLRKEHRDFLLSKLDQMISAYYTYGKPSPGRRTIAELKALMLSINDEKIQEYMINDSLEFTVKVENVIQRLGELIQETYKT